MPSVWCLLTVHCRFFPLQVYLQDISGSEPELRLQGTVDSPIIDPHLSPDGTMLAYVKDDELYILNLLSGEMKQLTFGARGNGKVRCLS